MNKKTWLCLIIKILTILVSCDIQVLLQNTDATLYTNNKILLKLKVKGAIFPYSIKFVGIPNTWETMGNDLVIPNFNKQLIQQWTFDLNITDAEKKTLYQTIKLGINKYQIMLYSMTIARTKDPLSSQGIFYYYEDSVKTATNSLNLTDLINRFPGINKDNNYGMKNSYVASSIITPQIIATSQAQWTPQRDAKPISVTQIKRNAATLRQNNADKAIANLVFIIQRLNNSTTNLKDILTNQTITFKNLKDAAFNCSEDLFNVQNNQAKINNAIADRITKKKQANQQINSINKILQLLQTNLTSLSTLKAEIQRSVTPQGLSLIQTQKLISDCEKSMKNLNTQIDNITAKVRGNNLQINLAQNNIDDANLRLVTVNLSLGVVKSKIDDLKQQLKEAQDQQLSLMKDQAIYLAVPAQSRIKMDNLNRKNQDLQDLSNDLSAKLRQQRDTCQKSSNNILTIKQRISQREQNYSQILLKIEENKNKIKTSEQTIKQHNLNIDRLSVQIVALNKELDKANLFEFQQKYVCAVSQQKKKRQQSRLNDINAQINQNNLALAQTTKNLQSARAQKQLADLAVQQIIKTTTNVTQFAIVPNGGSIKLGGFPLGNNPSGSALGPAFRADSIEKGSLQISNISNYLSTVYSMNIDPTQIFRTTRPPKTLAQSSLNTSDLSSILYPLDDKSRTQIIKPDQLSASLSASNCIPTAQLQTHSGLLDSVSLGSIIIRDNLNQKFTLSISPCTKIASTRSNNFFVVGNKVFFTGVQLFNILSNTLFDAYSILVIPP